MSTPINTRQTKWFGALALFLLLGEAALLGGCIGAGPHLSITRGPSGSPTGTPHVPGTVPAPEAAFGSMTSGSTAMQSERFKTYGGLGTFSGQVIELSGFRSTGVPAGIGTATNEQGGLP